MSFGLPQFGEHFKWREPLAVRHAIAPDPWHHGTFAGKLRLSALAAAPFLVMIAAAPLLRPRAAGPMTARTIVVFVGLALALGLFVGFIVPLANHFTRRRVRVGERAITIQSGLRPRASKRVKPIVHAYAREDVASFHIERQRFGRREFDLIRLRMRNGDDIRIGIHPSESADEISPLRVGSRVA